jgi:hypothetical protein
MEQPQITNFLLIGLRVILWLHMSLLRSLKSQVDKTLNSPITRAP